MAVEDGGGGSAPETPMSNCNTNIFNNNYKVKFLCSHGGRILPRSGDGHLKYIGGETRAVVVPRDITFSELQKKLASISETDTILKYQLILDDFEALVTVKNDEDLCHMVDEYDRHVGATGATKLRAFLFPSTPIIVESHTTPIDNRTRYVDAVNGIIRPSIIRAAVAGLRLRQVRRSPSPLRASEGTSPRSPDSCIADFRTLNQESTPPNVRQMGFRGGMHRVHSSPNVSSINQPPKSPPSQHNHHHGNHHHHYPPPQIHRLGHLSPTGSERLYSVRSISRYDASKCQAISSSNSYCPVSMEKRASMQ